MPHATTSPTSFATEGLLNDNRPFLAEAQAIVAREIAERPRSGVCWSGMTTPIEDVESVRCRLESLDTGRRAYLASPVGKARTALTNACRTCELNGWVDAWAAVAPVEAALDRNPATAAPSVEAAQVKLAALPESDGKVAMLLLATELKMLLREVA